MVKDQYEVIEPSKPEFEPTALIQIRAGLDNELVVRRFGPNTYNNNLTEMRRNYSCLPDYPKITFTPTTTGQSILVASVDFKNKAKPQIFDTNWLQAGPLVRTKTRVFASPPKNPDGGYITDEEELIRRLGDTEEFDGVFFNENGLGYCLLSSFETGKQSSETFARGGLARLLEGTRESVAERLASISSSDNYKLGVHVWGFNPVEKPVLRVAGPVSDRIFGRLDVGGDSLDGDIGCAFGVLKQTSEAGLQKSE